MIENSVYINSRVKWHSWLKRHHRKANEIWLVFYKKHTKMASIPYAEAVEEALCFGWVDSIKKRIDEDRYAFKFTPRKPTSLWSESNRNRVAKLIRENRMEPTGIRVVEVAKENGQWEKKTVAETKFSMPVELKSLLKKMTKEGINFQSKTKSQQKQFINWVASAKRPETRLKRAQEAIELLSQNRLLGLK